MTFKKYIAVSLSALMLSCCASPSVHTAANGSLTLQPVTQYADTKISQTQIHNIALLLPLKGQYSAQANAIRNGFFAAYYNEKNLTSTPPKITVYDTSNGNVTLLYQQAVSEGADFVVGPLTKNNIATLANSQRLAVPTLALNTIPLNKRVPNLYQFGLSPMSEAIQTAQKMWGDKKRRIAIIASEGGSAERIASTFQQAWLAEGGTITANVKFSNSGLLANQVRELLNVDATDQEAKNLQRILQEKVRTTPRHRHDIDAIFVVANPDDARQIKPLLNYYFAGNIPVYATSQIYPGFVNANRDRDLNGVIFCDIPWVLTPDNMQPSSLSSVRQRILSIWPDSFKRYPKLYAFGVDAYNVIPTLTQLASKPGMGARAATGILYLNTSQELDRKLVWSQIIDGVPRAI